MEFFFFGRNYVNGLIRDKPTLTQVWARYNSQGPHFPVRQGSGRPSQSKMARDEQA